MRLYISRLKLSDGSVVCNVSLMRDGADPETSVVHLHACSMRDAEMLCDKLKAAIGAHTVDLVSGPVLLAIGVED
jgi:siroheme synthase